MYVPAQWCTSLRICQCTAGSQIMLSGNLRGRNCDQGYDHHDVDNDYDMSTWHCQLIFLKGLGQPIARGHHAGRVVLLISSNAIKSGENYDQTK